MMMIAIIQIGFFLGLVGSVHCVGMCGPLVMGLPIGDKKGIQKGIAISMYHVGKIATYSLLGVVFGLLGSQILINKIQQNLSVIIGVMILIYVFYLIVLIPKKILSLNFFYQPIASLLSRLFKQNNVFLYLVIGLLNGLLPCGMVYLALTSALATQHVLQGGVLMFFFGLGTTPALLLVSFGGQMLSPVFRKKMQNYLPALLITMGLVLILRGMNLGIPYLSPHIGIGDQIVSCHNA
jgi:sulfite exporter TauE/SafE